VSPTIPSTLYWGLDLNLHFNYTVLSSSPHLIYAFFMSLPLYKLCPRKAAASTVPDDALYPAFVLPNEDEIQSGIWSAFQVQRPPNDVDPNPGSPFNDVPGLHQAQHPLTMLPDDKVEVEVEVPHETLFTFQTQPPLNFGPPPKHRQKSGSRIFDSTPKIVWHSATNINRKFNKRIWRKKIWTQQLQSYPPTLQP